MNEYLFFKARLYFTAIVTIAIWLLLAWGHYNGGVPSHHIMARADMPEISNWWGGILLPLLSWLLLYRVHKRIISSKNNEIHSSVLYTNVAYGLIGALFFGILLSIFFTFGYSDIQGYMMNGLFILALFLPIYRAECLLGFVIGMSFTFGAVLPTIAGLIFALIGAVLYLFVRPAALYIASALAHKVSSNKHKVNR
ncbi:hypothetical protein [Hymenobacter qilianensis]|uniref:Uncharacterized protein n=1 Tax=Hymenobacter qilianensis TaxID=1385715 RepID=A0A7H0GVK4_9BACT|nr:hypothetical protein [Hymenobacter qilianensis]QNP52320.1 hypothetical protein H9L05_00415 [Hymenobacter qilianensis]